MNNDNKSWLKILIGVLVVLYVVSPVDMLPGPVDDLLVSLFGIYMANRSGLREIRED